jgi:hypothetical protein
MKRSDSKLGMEAPIPANSRFSESEHASIRKFNAWMAKYKPVEREIYAAREKRAESKRRRAAARRKVFGDLCEMTDGMAKFCRNQGISLEEGERILSYSRPSMYMMGWVTLFEITWLAASFLRKELTRRIDRAKHKVIRPYYYEQERARRQSLAEERRKIRMRMTLNACPTKEEILDAWTKVKDSNEALLRFGSLMEDLECYVDNSLLRDENGAIIGRRSGIKGWLQMEIPALYVVYSRVMAYKAAAKRMRQVLDIHDPLPLSAVLGDETSGAKDANIVEKQHHNCGKAEIQGKEALTLDYGAEEIIWKGIKCDEKRLDEVDEVDVLRARAIYLEVMKPVGNGKRRQTALVERLLALTDPEKVDESNMLESWKAKYKHKITVRTKLLWERRLKGDARKVGYER